MEIILKKSFQDQIRDGYKDISTFATEILEDEIHEGQRAFLKKTHGKTFSFLHAGNRWGKGDVARIKGSYFAFYKPVPPKWKDKEICILNTSISQDQANIVLNKFEQVCTDRPKFSWIIKEIRHSPFPHIIFKNKVVWWFRNASQEGKYLLGRSYFWINFDEADYAKNLPELITEIIEPRTWDYGGSVDVMTTPKGKRNAYRLYKKRKDEGNPKHCFHQGDTRENTFIDQTSLRAKIKKMPVGLLRQNVKGEWVDSAGLISETAIRKSQEISTGLQIKPVQGHSYINAWDLARRSTFLVGVTLQVKPSVQLVSFERHQDSKDNPDSDYWHNAIAKITNRQKIWGGRTVIDKTGLGDVVFEFIPKHVRAIGLDLGSSARGGGRLKSDIVQNGISCINMEQVGIPQTVEQVTNEGTWTLEDELRDFCEDTRGIVWDAVCALFLGLYIINNPDAGGIGTPRSPSIVGAKGASKYGHS